MSRRRKPPTRRRRTAPLIPRYRATLDELAHNLGGTWTTRQALEYQEHQHRLLAGETRIDTPRIDGSAARARHRRQLHNPMVNR
jgi:hypothetical protein